MTTAQIETHANRGDVARDFDLGSVLRYQVIPEFLQDVKVCSWRKRYATVTTAAAGRHYVLASDFAEMREVTRDGYGDLEYIGEDDQKVLAAENSTTNAKPTAYYIGRNPAVSGSGSTHLFLSAPADGVYTIRYGYLYRIVFTDTTTSVDLKQYIPEEYHWGLVDGLKREIYEDRFGLNDPRALKAASNFDAWKQRALNSPEIANHGRYVVTV